MAGSTKILNFKWYVRLTMLFKNILVFYGKRKSLAEKRDEEAEER